MHSKPREAQFVHGLARLHRVFLSLQLSHAFFTEGCAADPAGGLLTDSEAVTSFEVVGGDSDGDEFAIQTFQKMTGTRQEERRGAVFPSQAIEYNLGCVCGLTANQHRTARRYPAKL